MLSAQERRESRSMSAQPHLSVLGPPLKAGGPLRAGGNRLAGRAKRGGAGAEWVAAAGAVAAAAFDRHYKLDMEEKRR